MGFKSRKIVVSFLIMIFLAFSLFSLSSAPVQAGTLTLPGEDGSCEWHLFLDAYFQQARLRAINGCGVGSNAAFDDGGFAACGGEANLDQGLAGAGEDSWSVLKMEYSKTNETYVNYAYCCCPKPTASETESVIGGSVWANPFDNLQIKIPGLTGFSNPVCVKTDFGESCYVPWIGEYIKGIYNYAIGIAGILALIAVLVGGLIWLTSGGSASKVTEAKSWIFGGVTGLVLLMASYLLLTQINSSLVNFKSIKVDILKTSEQCPVDLAREGKCVACHECTKLNVPVKSGMGNSVNHELADSLWEAYQSQKGWEVTEAWPPTVAHTATCHANGTCVDVGVKGNDAPDNVQKIYDALTAQGLRVVFETDKGCADYTGMTCKDKTDSGFEHITGPHFSVYSQ